MARVLRNVLLALGACSFALGLTLFATGDAGPSIVFAIWGMVLVVGLVIERFRYKRLASGSPGPGWERSAERFVDEETGKMVTVYTRPETGERLYVKE